MIFAIDSNILLYAIDQDSEDKRRIAHDIVARGWPLDAVISSQVLGEFLAVVRRKQPSYFDEAAKLVERWALVFQVAWTGPENIIAGAKIASRHRLQFWDSVILEIARERGAGVLLTEDMQDGATIEGIRILNPFRADNRALLDQLLGR